MSEFRVGQVVSISPAAWSCANENGKIIKHSPEYERCWGVEMIDGEVIWFTGDELVSADPPASDDEAWLAEVRAQLANIPTGDYQVMPPEPNFYWRSVGLRDPDDNERVNQIAEVSVIQIRRGDHIEDRRTLPEFFAAAPDTIRRLLDALRDARRERDAAVRAIRAIITDCEESLNAPEAHSGSYTYVGYRPYEDVLDILEQHGFYSYPIEAQESDDDHE